MFQLLSTEQRNYKYLKSCCDHYVHERDKKIVFHNTPELQDQDHDVQDQDRYFLVSDRTCPKTDGLRPHNKLCVGPPRIPQYAAITTEFYF